MENMDNVNVDENPEQTGRVANIVMWLMLATFGSAIIIFIISIVVLTKTTSMCKEINARYDELASQMAQYESQMSETSADIAGYAEEIKKLADKKEVSGGLSEQEARMIADVVIEELGEKAETYKSVFSSSESSTSQNNKTEDNSGKKNDGFDSASALMDKELDTLLGILAILATQ